MSDTTDDVGYRKPPKSTRFKKGQRANPHGRPRRHRTEDPYEAVLGQLVTIREDGVERQVTAAEAFLLLVIKEALAGNRTFARAATAVIEKARAMRQVNEFDVTTIRVIPVARGSVNAALAPLRIARKLDRSRETARMALEPWVVGAALSRLGDRRLTLEEQEIVVRALGLRSGFDGQSGGASGKPQIDTRLD